MTDEQKSSAELALKNAVWNVQKGHFMAAQSWAESAAEMLEEANLDQDQLRKLVAPNEWLTTGDKVVITLSASVGLWMVVSMIFGVWSL